MDEAVKEFLSANGKKGGKSRSPKKIEALKKNMEKANQALKAYWANYKPKTAKISKRNKDGSFKGEVCSE